MESNFLKDLPDDVIKQAVVFKYNKELSWNRIKDDLSNGKNRSNVPLEVLERQIEQYDNGYNMIESQFDAVIYI